MQVALGREALDDLKKQLVRQVGELLLAGGESCWAGVDGHFGSPKGGGKCEYQNMEKGWGKKMEQAVKLMGEDETKFRSALKLPPFLF